MGVFRKLCIIIGVCYCENLSKEPITLILRLPKVESNNVLSHIMKIIGGKFLSKEFSAIIFMVVALLFYKHLFLRKGEEKMKKINWKLRLQNKVTLLAIVLQIIAIIYALVGAFGIELPIDENSAVKIAESIVGVLVLIGVVTDPTTSGVTDSSQALNYENPKEG